MTASKALLLAFRQRLTSDATFTSLAPGGVFLGSAPSEAALPYATYRVTSELTMDALRTTWGMEFMVQLKNWAQDSGGFSGAMLAQEMSDAAASLFHCRDDAGFGTTASMLSDMSALSSPNGWVFGESAIYSGIPMYADAIGDREVWCRGHVFKFWLQRAA